MTPAHTPPRSGCGVGSAVPAGTPQEGVRGEKRSRADIKLSIIALESMLAFHTKHYPTDYAFLSRLHQQLADAYAALRKGSEG